MMGVQEGEQNASWQPGDNNEKSVLIENTKTVWSPQGTKSRNMKQREINRRNKRGVSERGEDKCWERECWSKRLELIG